MPQPADYRYDEFLAVSNSRLIQAESLLVPSSSPYYVALAEVPESGSLLVRTNGTSTTISAQYDAYVYQGAPTTNYGSGAYLAAGRDDAGAGSSYIFHTFIQFDLTTIGAGNSLVKLRLYCEATNALPTFFVNRVTSTWSEGGVTYNTQPTWNSVAEASVAITQAGKWYEWDVTALVNAWKAGTYTNYGFILRTNDIDTGTVCNWTTRTGGGANTPQLVAVSAGNTLTAIPQSQAPTSSQYAVAYDTGRLRFHSSKAGSTLQADYLGTGSILSQADVPQYAGTTGGTSSAYTVTSINTAVPPFAGQALYVKFHTGNSASCTINVNGNGAKNLWANGAAIGGSVIAANKLCLLVYDGTQWHLL